MLCQVHIVGADEEEKEILAAFFFHPNDKLTVTLAAKYSGVFSFAGGETSGIANLVGGTVGLNIKLGDSFALHPYAGVTLSMDQDVITFPHGGIGARFSL